RKSEHDASRATLPPELEEDFHQVVPLSPVEQQHRKRFIPYVAAAVAGLGILAVIGMYQRGTAPAHVASATETRASEAAPPTTQRAAAEKPELLAANIPSPAPAEEEPAATVAEAEGADEPAA